MAILRVTEFSNIAGDGRAKDAQIPQEPNISVQTITYTTATQSTAFTSSTYMVRFIPTATCYIRFGENPTAVATDEDFYANVEYYRGVKPGHKMSVYDGAS